GQYIAEVVIEGKVLDRNLQFVKNVILDLKSSICEKCLKRKTKYYEAIIQLRGKGRVGIDSEIKKAFESILEPEEVSNISDIVESKEGIDYYFINKSVARRIVNRLASKYKIEVKESFYNIKVKDGKRSAKLIISVRM
ncbi:MAG: NMD3-related protein, partial [Metallosphaera sp.]